MVMGTSLSTEEAGIDDDDEARVKTTSEVEGEILSCFATFVEMMVHWHKVSRCPENSLPLKEIGNVIKSTKLRLEFTTRMQELVALSNSKKGYSQSSGTESPTLSARQGAAKGTF